MGEFGATGYIWDTDTGWSFDGILEEPGYGYVIGNLKHDGHLCANQIRIERILVASHYATGTKRPLTFENFTLGSNRVTRIGEPKLIKLGEKMTDPRGFYNPRFGVLTVYALEKVFGEPNQHLLIEHLTMFTPYNKDPAHEPGGILRAARIYPMIKFSSPPPASGTMLQNPNNRIAAIRVLYRMGFQVTGSKITNQAGIFRDHDDVGTFKSLSRARGSGSGKLFFERAEKPLISEAVGRGIIRKSDLLNLNGDQVGWDNIHQWNAQFKDKYELLAAGEYDRLPPTPGLPYGVHQHWRWARVFYEGLWSRFKGGLQFGGLGGAGGPMIDPKVPDQMLEFAITQQGLREKHVRDVLNDPNHMIFDYPLEGLLAESGMAPVNISLGASLATWVDITAYSDYIDEEHPFTKSNSTSFDGTLFAHGVFFAHESEEVLRRLPPMPDSRKHQYLPHYPIQSRWRRPESS